MIEKIVNIMSVIVILIGTIVIGAIFVKGGNEIKDTLVTVGQEISSFPAKVIAKNEATTNKEAKMLKITNPSPVDVCYILTIVGGIAVIAAGSAIVLKEYYEV